jgi:hypothetical protein
MTRPKTNVFEQIFKVKIDDYIWYKIKIILIIKIDRVNRQST